MKIIISDHAFFEAKRRDISEELIRALIKNPQQKVYSKKGRVILQNKYYDIFKKKEILLRVVGIEKDAQFRVITVYNTSKIEKYWLKGD